jgi:hypothetical protein
MFGLTWNGRRNMGTCKGLGKYRELSMAFDHECDEAVLSLRK